MIDVQQYADDFREYIKPLEALENAFNAAGMNIKFRLYINPAYGKTVEVIGGFASQKLICIEADSPVAAIKDVVAGVKIS